MRDRRVSRRRRQRSPRVYEAACRSDCTRDARFRDWLAHAWPARTRQNESAADFCRSNRRFDPAPSLRRSLHRHVSLSRNSSRCAGTAWHARADLRLESRDADESRACQAAHSRNSSQPSTPRRRHVQGIRHIARDICRRRAHYRDAGADCLRKVVVASPNERRTEPSRRLAQARLQSIIARTMSRTKALSTGLVAGLVAAVAMTVMMLLLAYVGVATPLVIIGDRLSVFISPGPFLSLMGKVGGYNHLKQLGVRSAIYALELRALGGRFRTDVRDEFSISHKNNNWNQTSRIHSRHRAPRICTGRDRSRVGWRWLGLGAQTLSRGKLQLRRLAI